jgi:hypothetical protein
MKLPQNVETEARIIASCLLYPGDCEKFFESLEPEYFYKTAHRDVFTAMKNMKANGQEINLNSLQKTIADNKCKISAAELSKFADIPVCTGKPDFYINKITETARKRQLIIEQNNLLKQSYRDDVSVDETLCKHREIINSFRKPETKITGENLTQFPYQVMTGAAGYYAGVYGDIVEAPEHFHFMAYLTCLGNVLSPQLTLASALNTQPRLYTVIVGESATDRKSTTLAIAVKHFQVIIKRYQMAWGMGSAEGLSKALKRTEKQDQQEAKQLLLCFDEFKSFVSKCNIDSSVLLPAVATLFESNIYENYTKKQTIKISNGYLSLLAATTIETYERIYNSAFLDIGFPNRIWLVPGTAKRQFSIPGKIDPAEQTTMSEQLVSILRHVGDSLELDITSEAREYYHNWYMNLEPSVHSKRLDTYSLRFMMLLAANDLKNEIDLETAKHATALCDWQLEVRRQNDPIDADTNISKMEERIRRQLKNRGPLKDGSLKKYVNARKYGLWVYGNALTNLQRAKEVARNRLTKELFLSGG